MLGSWCSFDVFLFFFITNEGRKIGDGLLIFVIDID